MQARPAVPRWSSRPELAARLAASLAAALLTLGCESEGDKALQTSGSPTESLLFDPESGVDVGGATWSVKYGFDGLWVAVDPPVDQVVKVDRATGEVAFAVNNGRGVAIAPESVWVATGKQVLKVDPATGKTRSTIAAPTSYVAFGAGSVWGLSNGSLQRYDPQSAALLATVPLKGHEGTEVAATSDAVWVTSKKTGSVVHVDPAPNAVVATVKTGMGAHGIIADDTGVWVTNYTGNTVSRIDPATDKVTATIENVGSGVGIAAGDGAIWVSTKSEGVARIDPSTSEVTPLGPASAWPYWSYGVAYVAGDLWVSSAGESQALHKVRGVRRVPLLLNWGTPRVSVDSRARVVRASARCG